MEQATTIGLDIAKHVFQVHGADSAGHVLFRKRITRGKLLGFLAAQAPCIVAMEACAGAHYWAREIAQLGHHVRVIAPAYVKPFIRRSANPIQAGGCLPAASEAGQMTASDHAQQRPQRFPLPKRGRPQMESGHCRWRVFM